MAKTSLDPFDPARDFIATRGFLCRGRWYEEKEEFDKKSVSVRTLRILYDARSVTYAARADGAPEPMNKFERSVLEMSTDAEVLKAARKLGLRPAARASKVQIIKQIAQARDATAHG